MGQLVPLQRGAAAGGPGVDARRRRHAGRPRGEAVYTLNALDPEGSEEL